MPHHRLALCGKDFINWFERYTKRTLKEFRMFSHKDKILVAVSGGKDSLALWYLLCKLGYRADALHINLGIGEYSEKSLQKSRDLSLRLKAELFVVDLSKELAGIPELQEKTVREACSICGLVKRYNFNKFAREKGYSVVATGHNLDDETSSLLSNVLNWNLKYLGRKSPVLEEEKGFVKKVKPFCKFTEKETALYALLNGIDFIEEECPFSKDASTVFYKELLNRIEEKFPGTKLRFYLEYIRKILPKFNQTDTTDLKKCKICGEPSPTDVCSFCRLKEITVR